MKSSENSVASSLSVIFRRHGLAGLGSRRWACIAAFSSALSVESRIARAESAPPVARVEEQPVLPPKLLGDANVPYPEGGTGDATVVLVVVIGPEGEVRSAAPETETPPFSEHAARAALSFRFEPALRSGKAVASKIRIEVVFREPESPDAELTSEPAAESEPSQAPTPAAAAPEPREIIVQGERAEPSRSASLTRAEVRQIPGTFGDPFRAIETMPGVTPIVSGLPFFFIRGAPPGNVGYFLDGLRVPLLFHVGVGPSVVHPASIERVDLYPGGYPARFGRFAGGVVAGETAPPKDELTGEYNVRLFDLGAFVETPFDSGRGAAMLAGRYSYTALLLSLMSPETTLDYWDYQGRVSYELTPNDRLTLFSFGSYDYVGEKAETQTLTVFGTEFHRVEARYDHALDDGGRFRSALSVGLDRSRAQQTRFVRDRVASARSELVSPLATNVRLRAGTDFQIDHYDVELGPGEFSPAASQVVDLFPSRTDVALGLRADLVITVDSHFEVTPGVRMDLFGSQGVTAWAVDPRLQLRAMLNPRINLLAALGMAHQPPAFVVPVPGFQPAGLRGGLQRSVQESLGFEFDLGAGTTASATVFQNAFFNMSDPLGATEPELSGCAPGAYPTDSIGPDFGARWDGNAPYCGPRFPPGTLGPDRSGGGGQAADSRGGRRIAGAFEVRTTGSAHGLELFLKRRLTGKLGGFLSYTLSRSTRSHGRRRYIAAFDRTHVLNVAAAYDLGRSWRAGARTVFYTGLPKAADPADPDSTRLPAFFRLDLRLEKRWQLGEKAWIAFVAEWMNATLSKEAVTTSCTLAGCESQMIGPVTIPSLGVEGGF